MYTSVLNGISITPNYVPFPSPGGRGENPFPPLCREGGASMKGQAPSPIREERGFPTSPPPLVLGRGEKVGQRLDLCYNSCRFYEIY